MKNLENITEGNTQGLLMPCFGERREVWKAWFRWKDLLPLEENSWMQLLILKMLECFILSLNFLFFFLAYLIKQPIGLSEGDFLARAIYSWGTGLILNPCWASPCYSPSDLATVLLVVHSMFSALCFPSPISNGALHTWWMSSRKTAWKINDNNAADDFPGPELDHEALVLADIGTEDASPERW